MENSERLAIPEGVVDVSAYKKYWAYTQSSIWRNRYYSASDGEEIDLGLMPTYLKKVIKKYSPTEQDIILEMKRKRLQMMGKINSAKATAFGTRKSRYKEQKAPNPVDVLEADIVELLGRLFSINEVVRIVGEDNGIAIKEEDVRQILKRNIVEVERKREAYRNRATDVRLYNKRPRLEELAWMYGKMKMRYITMGGENAYNAMLRTLEQLRKEAEGDILNINGAIDVNLNIELNAHVQKEILRTINIKEIILGRVAARMNYSTNKLIAGLHNSYYNKFVQISGDYDPTAEMQYPSLINYDFAEIEARNAQVDDIVDVKCEPVTEPEREKANTIKEIFLAKIRAQREEAERRSSSSIADVQDMGVKEDYDDRPDVGDKRGHYRDDQLLSKTKGTGKKL